MFYDPESLESALAFAEGSGNQKELLKVHSLIATSESRYDFANPNLNAVAGFVPTPFAEWLAANWANAR
jgi:hypothetical protein